MKKSYNQFRQELLDWYREKHPNSSAPREHMISMFYDDYLENDSTIQNVNYSKLKIYEIAQIIKKDWKNVNYAAKPYLDAMFDLSEIEDRYIADSGASIVAYFLSNASSWKGGAAKAIKKELNRRVKTYYK